MTPSDEKIKEHEMEINALKVLVEKSSQSMNDCTLAMRDLTLQFSIFSTKHDNTEAVLVAIKSDIKDMSKTINSHASSISGMQPTVDGVRGLVWKMVTAVITGMGGISLIVIQLADK